MRRILNCIFILILFGSCNTTKNIPEGQYLLNSNKIEADSKKIDEGFYENFLRQQPNNKLRLGLYNMAGDDTTKWLNRFIRNKLGQAPVIYSPQLTGISMTQIRQQLNNQGYLRARVDTTLKVEDQKISVTYNIENNGMYKIRNYEYTIYDPQISRSLIPARKYTSIQPGVEFNQENLEGSRNHLTSFLRNIGYYNFSKEYLYFRVDTTLNSHEADVYLSLYEPRDSTTFKKFMLRNVTITSGFDGMSRDNRRYFTEPDTTEYKGIRIVHGRNNFLKKSTLYRNNFLRPGNLYSDTDYTRTTGAFNGISVIRQTRVTFNPVDGNPNDSIQLLDANINVVPGNTHFLQAELQGTNSAGDLGIAPSVTYQHQNLFNGGEIFRIKLRGAYEFIANSEGSDLSDKNYYEYGADASLSFPLFLFPWLKRSWREQPSASTQITLGFNNQHRKEYTRQFFNAGLTYRWSSFHNQLTHALGLWNINYVRMPWASDAFKDRYLNNPDPIYAMIRESYKDQLISSTTYGLTFTNSYNRFGRTPKNLITIRGNIDISGWLPRLVTSFYDAKRDSTGKKEIVGIAYAEYIKGDLSYSQTHRLNTKTSLAFRVGLGVATPFGNSDVLPFESRYFSGGANSVRGWSTRALGPGSMPYNDRVNFVTKVGDVKLDLNFEYRRKLTDLFEFAGFVDAGNIWTIKDYEAQPDGKFQFSDFYKEIALAYGIGVRLDLSFLLLRLDFGFRAYDPGRSEGDRWVTPNFSGDRMAWHFGIGYPF